jgi:hypothetical protein
MEERKIAPIIDWLSSRDVHGNRFQIKTKTTEIVQNKKGRDWTC